VLWTVCAFTVKALNTAIRPQAKLSVLSGTTHLRHLHNLRRGEKKEKAKNQPSSFKMRIEATHTSLDLSGYCTFLVKMAQQQLKHKVLELNPFRGDSSFCGIKVGATLPSSHNTLCLKI